MKKNHTILTMDDQVYKQQITVITKGGTNLIVSIEPNNKLCINYCPCCPTSGWIKEGEDLVCIKCKDRIEKDMVNKMGKFLTYHSIKSKANELL